MALASSRSVTLVSIFGKPLAERERTFGHLVMEDGDQRGLWEALKMKIGKVKYDITRALSTCI